MALDLAHLKPAVTTHHATTPRPQTATIKPLWAGTVAHQLRIAYLVAAWRSELVVVTDRRLIRVSGVFATTVDDRTIALSTDRTLQQSFWGRVLGYGTLRVGRRLGRGGGVAAPPV